MTYSRFKPAQPTITITVKPKNPFRARFRFTSGNKGLDKLLGGGLETQTITEFYGECDSSKSQMCHQLWVNVQLPLEHGGLEGAALFLSAGAYAEKGLSPFFGANDAYDISVF